MEFESKITSKGRTTIPKAVREALGLKLGDTLRYSIVDGVVKMMPTISAVSLYGILKYEGKTKTLEEMEEGIRKGATKGW